MNGHSSILADEMGLGKFFILYFFLNTIKTTNINNI